jgi:sugar phosphate isomerase/epimerase
MARIPIGLELYSVRNDLAKDPRGTLKAVAEMGYEGVEFAGPFAHPVPELRKWLDEFGLACCGWHCPFHLVQDDKLAETIATTQAVGNKYVIVPGLPGHLIKTRADWQKMAGFFNDLAGKLAPHGLLTGYHNHHIEFTPLDGEQPWDTFFGNTRKEVVMQLDTGNALFGGGDCVSILKRYPGRAVTVHLKPYSLKAAQPEKSAGFKPLIGDDELPWNEIFRLCETTGDTAWYIVEYESDAFAPLEAVKRCLQNLKAMGK